jgi:hypothetical protein
MAMKELFGDSNMTVQGDTAWMDSLDPLYGRIADVWMKKLIAAFGTDHYYQMDGYFGLFVVVSVAVISANVQLLIDSLIFSQKKPTDGGTAPWYSAQAAAATTESAPKVAGGAPWPVPDPMAFRRATAAYMGLNRTDPDSYWSYQGWQIVGW